MPVFTQDNDFVYIDLASLPPTDFPSLSSEAQLFDRVLKAAKVELITTSLIFTTLDPIEVYRLINNAITTKNIKFITIPTIAPTFDPDEVI